MIARTLETPIHGRFLHEDRGGERLLVGFHGYAETAEANLAQLEKIRGIERWSVAAVQALHPFYTGLGSVVANWMTTLDRELAIADNVEYVRRVVASLPVPRTLVFLGFSQGVAMAVRAAARSAPAAGLILLGGDIPPDITDDGAVVLPRTLLGRGTLDPWYDEEKFKKDLSYLERTTRVTPCVFDGEHEWTDEFREAVATFLEAL
ncbi:MAG TPA: phospholipase [Thermoanaerobaculia bacterium]|nr:phospholipase [Thermoanaerobaculia bacterium]